jgi:hypothetical protein
MSYYFIKARIIRWEEHVIHTGETRKANKCFVGRHEGKRPLERPRRRWEYNIRMDLRELCGKLCFGFIWFRVRANGGFL